MYISMVFSAHLVITDINMVFIL